MSNATVQVTPGILTCAVRYALGRRSYMPWLVCDQVRANLDRLGNQRDVIASDIEEWLNRDETQAGDWDYEQVWGRLLGELRGSDETGERP